MKYIEELEAGDSFSVNGNYYIATIDFKKNNTKLCIDLVNGSNRWFEATVMVEPIQIYRLDKENNIIPLKETKKDVITENQNIS